MTPLSSPPQDTASSLLIGAVDEIRRVLTAGAAIEVEKVCDEIQAARRIVCYGVGREGLMMSALCMRLMHLGFDAHGVGDMTTPPIAAGDVLLVSAGPGSFSTVYALLGVARSAGARTVVVTAQPDGEASRLADSVIFLKAQTMATDHEGSSPPMGVVSVLPMGSLYEVAMLVFFDVCSIRLRQRTEQTADDMRSRHTNLE